MKVAGIDHFAVRSANLEATLRLYVEGLGFRELYRWSRPPQVKSVVMLDSGNGVKLEVFDHEAMVVGTRPSSEASPDEGPAVGVIHIAVSTHDLEGTFRSALVHGGQELIPPTAMELTKISGDCPPSMRMAFVRGLDGEVIEIVDSGQL